MSDTENQLLLERASELIDATTGMSFIPQTVERLIKANELDELRKFIAGVEASLSLEHFHGYDIIGEQDIY